MNSLISKATKTLHLPYKFSTNKKIYKPLIPLLQKYNVIYSHPKFAEGTLIRNYPLYWYLSPAGFMIINNYLLDWNILRSAAFIAFVGAGIFMRSTMIKINSVIVQCIQINSQSKKIYVTLQNSPVTKLLADQYGIDKQQLNQLKNSYHPIKLKHPDIKILFDIDGNDSHEKTNINPKLLKNIRSIQSQLLRVCIPLQNLKFKLDLTMIQEPQYQRNLERLTPKQIMRKYQKNMVFIKVKLPKQNIQLPFELKLQASNNAQIRHQQYLLALALGFQIDTTGNRKFEQSKGKQNKKQSNTGKQTKTQTTQDKPNKKDKQQSQIYKQQNFKS